MFSKQPRLAFVWKNFEFFWSFFFWNWKKGVFTDWRSTHSIKTKFYYISCEWFVEKSPFLGTFSKILTRFMAIVRLKFEFFPIFPNVSIFMYSNNIFHRVLCSIDVFWGVLWSRLTLRQWYKQFKQKNNIFFKCVPCNVHILSRKHKTTSNWF